MAWYRSGTVTSVAGTNVITGTGTLWNNPIFGIASGQMIFVPGAGQVVIYEILAVDSDTKIRVTKNISSAITNSEYAIVTTVSNSMSDLARRTAVQLALYQQLLEDWQNITTGTGDVTIIAPDGTEVVIPALSWITDSKTWFDANRELIDNAGEGSLIPIGVPLPYPLATAPTGYLKCNGSSFSTTTYPQLAVAYPSGVLPDLRGEFIRGWDAGRGIDIGRAILGSQSDALQNHLHFISTMGPKGTDGGNIISPTDDTGRLGDADSWLVGAGNWTTYGSPSGRVAEETRPRNIAFNYIVRAA